MRRFGPLLLAVSSFAQLTSDQRAADFLALAGTFSKHYAPYDWKKTAFQFDLLDAKPWLDRIAQAKDDLAFYEICVEYLSRLNDTHVNFTLPSTFSASLGFTVDIYDGKVLVDSIDRDRLPLAQFPFQIGDELVSVDGRDTDQLLRDFAIYGMQANPRSTRRRAAERSTRRTQSRMPHATEIGETATVVVRRWGGSLETYEMPWRKTGYPLAAGPVPSPKMQRRPAAAPEYPTLLRHLQNSHALDLEGVLNSGTRAPLFLMPDGFQQRLGRSSADALYSGVFTAGAYRIGFIRIPSYSGDTATGLRQFESEIQYFQQNTDGLVIDEMRNPGGELCYGEAIAARLIPVPFRPMLFEIRATSSWIVQVQTELELARALQMDQATIDGYQRVLDAMLAANAADRGCTAPIPLCGISEERVPPKDRLGNPIAYTKPIVLLIDEFSTSTADSVAAILQDAGRATLVGWRTNGAGGTNGSADATIYSEATAGITLGLMTRKNQLATPDYPATSYVENVGVRPDIEYDYMTRDNLMQSGRPFVEAFTKAVVEAIGKSR